MPPRAVAAAHLAAAGLYNSYSGILSAHLFPESFWAELVGKIREQLPGEVSEVANDDLDRILAEQAAGGGSPTECVLRAFRTTRNEAILARGTFRERGRVPGNAVK